MPNKLDYLRIKLDKTNPVYKPGEKITGKVSYKVGENFKIKSVELTLYGDCRVQWNEIVIKNVARGRRAKYNQEYNFNELYVCKKSVLQSKPDGSEFNIYLGEKILPFEIELPYEIGSSFEHNYGRNRYAFVCNVITTKGFEKSTTKYISIVADHDLNLLNQILKQPYGISAKKVVCCGFCSSEPIECKFSTKKRAYVSGEKLYFSLILENRSSKEIEQIHVDFIQKLKFYTPRKIKSCNNKLFSIEYPKKVAKKTKVEWEDSISLKGICPSFIGECKLISVSYMLICNFDASGISTNTDLIIPITIGTMPYEDDKDKMTLNYETSSYSEPCKLPLEVEGIDETEFKPIYPDYSLIEKNTS